MKDLFTLTPEEIDRAVLYMFLLYLADGSFRRTVRIVETLKASPEFMKWAEALSLAAGAPMAAVASFMSTGVDIGYQLAITQQEPGGPGAKGQTIQ